jgi:hypothetical protein
MAGFKFAGITLLAILLIGSLIAAFYAPSIERALTVNTARRPTMPVKVAVTAPVGQTATTQASGATILAQDTFQRADQTFWGTASDGQSWGGDANTLRAFSIAGASGQIVGSGGQNGQIYNALLGPASRNAEVVATASVNAFGPEVNFGVLLRWNDVNNWYKALIDGSQLVVIKHVNGVTTQLGAVSFPAAVGKAYTLHFQVIGATLFASAWPSGGSEPQQWMLVVSDISLMAGRGGVRVVIDNDTVIHVSSFLETVASSGI